MGLDRQEAKAKIEELKENIGHLKKFFKELDSKVFKHELEIRAIKDEMKKVDEEVKNHRGEIYLLECNSVEPYFQVLIDLGFRRFPPTHRQYSGWEIKFEFENSGLCFKYRDHCWDILFGAGMFTDKSDLTSKVFQRWEQITRERINNYRL